MAENTTILVKFATTNPELLPKGVQIVERKPNEISEKQLEMGDVNAECDEHVSMNHAIKQLFKAGFHISNVHAYIDEKGEHSTKYVLVVAFSYRLSPYYVETSIDAGKTTHKLTITKYSKEFMESVFHLSCCDAWNYVYTHMNQNGLVSITCLHRLPDMAHDDDVTHYNFEFAR